MTVAEARTLKVGQRVEWTADGTRGTIREATYAAVKIEWDDGKWALMPFDGDRVPFGLLRKLAGSNLIGGAS